MTVIDQTIRQANELDIPRIVEMGRRFLLEGPYHDHLADEPAAATLLAKGLVGRSDAKILVSEGNGYLTGVFAFLVFPYPYSGEMVAGELFWYVEPEAREGGIGLKLLWEAEKLAQSLGARRMHMTTPATQGSIAGIFERYGYKAVEIAYQKNLKCQR